MQLMCCYPYRLLKSSELCDRKGSRISDNQTMDFDPFTEVLLEVCQGIGVSICEVLSIPTFDIQVQILVQDFKFF